MHQNIMALGDLIIYNKNMQRQKNYRPQKYHGFDQQFFDYLFGKIVADGGLRLQIIASDMINELQQKYDAKHPLNLYRKQYGNVYEAIKAIPAKNQFFILDNMVIKMKKPGEVRQMQIKKELMQKYQAKLIENQKKEIQIMKINNQNKCKKCGKVYNIHVNKKGLCGGQAHEHLY